MSFVVPVRNEAEAIPVFVEKVCRVAAEVNAKHELVFVNDGSTDATLEVLFGLQAAGVRIRIVNLSRNFGKEAALTAGLHHCEGDVAIPIDVDLQDPPELLGPFLAQWRNGYDVVYGIRRSRAGDSRLVRTTARWFYRTFNMLSSTPIPPDVGDFRLMDRRVVEAVLELGERSRFMKGMFAWVGYPSVGVEFERPERSRGATSWTSWRRWNLALDGIASFSATPLRVWTYVGLGIAAACAAYSLFVLGLALAGGTRNVPGYASMLIVILSLGALQLISLGLLGEYLGRVMVEAKQRPVFLTEGVYDAAVASTPPLVVASAVGVGSVGAGQLEPVSIPEAV